MASKSKSKGPDLKRYLDKRLSIKLNARRGVTGVLRGYDKFLNLVLDESREERGSEKIDMGGMIVIRGNAIVEIECLENIRTR